MKILRLALLTVFCFLVPAHASDLRIGLIGLQHPVGCFEQEQLSDVGAIAYAEHIAGRFASNVVLCFGEEGLSSSSDEPDLIWGPRENLTEFSSEYRPFLTPRRSNGLGRVPIVFFKQASESKTSLLEFKGEGIALSNRNPSALHTDMPFEVLASFGLSRDDFDLIAADGPLAVVNAVASGEAQFAALEATSWARTCNANIADYDDCGQLSVITIVRPRAEHGMVIRRDAEKERRYRMVGVHTRMHFENAPAFLWLVGPDAPELEPTEEEAFTIGIDE